ncbi:MAG: rRNA maturation RNase YbeY [Paramuribaculum sp.]|nr:rRNA maturation RNase YbeY [Paramuribaculum sp.]
MSNRIFWHSDGVEMPRLDFEKTELWLQKVAQAHQRIVGPLNYIFCNDEKIIDVNRQYLNHDYYTDIITFDYSRSKMVSGDMYISLDTVESNAAGLGVEYQTELNRVIVHGLLHLCGIDDKGVGEREIMEANENAALDILKDLTR